MEQSKGKYMLLPPADGERLNSNNFLRVDSQAIRSIDFVQGKTLEIEFIDGEVYHYYKAPVRLWKRMIRVVNSGESLGTYVNQEFKKEVSRLNIDYRLIRVVRRSAKSRQD